MKPKEKPARKFNQGYLAKENNKKSCLGCKHYRIEGFCVWHDREVEEPEKSRCVNFYGEIRPNHEAWE